MIDVKIKGSIKFPDITLQKDLEMIAERVVIPNMVKGILKRIGVDGKALPDLEPATVKKKGHDRPLIDTGKLHRAFKYVKKGKYAVLIKLKSNRKDIGSYLQIDGIRAGTRTKHFNFFGISKLTEAAAIHFMKALINKRLKRA